MCYTVKLLGGVWAKFLQTQFGILNSVCGLTHGLKYNWYILVCVIYITPQKYGINVTFYVNV